MTDFPPGSIVDGRYEILSVLGEGGMGVVYEARHADMQRIVALKVLKAVLDRQPNKLARFKNEAHVISSLSHPNIVSVYSVGMAENGMPYIAMEMLQGATLADLLRDSGPLPYQNALPFFIQVCDALSHAHAQSIIHRDLKPSNFVIQTDTGDSQRLKVVDFGIAKILSVEQGLTQTTSVAGSVFYMSPEQCEGRAPDRRSDIYSIGCSLFEALTGRPPVACDSVAETMIARTKVVAPLVSLVRPDAGIPSALDKLVACCLEIDPDHRYNCVEDLRADLQNVMSGHDLRHVPVKVRSRTGLCLQVSSRAKQLLLVVLVVAAGLTVLTAYMLQKSPEGEDDLPAGVRCSEAARLYYQAWRLMNDVLEAEARGEKLEPQWTKIDDALKSADRWTATLDDPYMKALSAWHHAHRLSLQLKQSERNREDSEKITGDADSNFQRSAKYFELARTRIWQPSDNEVMRYANHSERAMLADNVDYLKWVEEPRRIPRLVWKFMENIERSRKSQEKVDYASKKLFDRVFGDALMVLVSQKDLRSQTIDFARQRVRCMSGLKYPQAVIDQDIEKMASMLDQVDKQQAARIRELHQP